jgi:hypothetical protein
MIFPIFSLRAALIVMTALCGYFLILSFAVAGQKWAIAVAVASAAAWTTALVFAALYGFGWLFTLLSGLVRWLTSAVTGAPAEAVQSPFATDRLPPVVVAPPPDATD